MKITSSESRPHKEVLARSKIYKIELWFHSKPKDKQYKNSKKQQIKVRILNKLKYFLKVKQKMSKYKWSLLKDKDAIMQKAHHSDLYAKARCKSYICQL